MGSEMMKVIRKVIRDSDGKVINVGAWEYQRNNKGQIVNPLPPGAYEDDAELVIDSDGGKHERMSWLIYQSKRLLVLTDYVIPKAAETGRFVNPAWRAWRQKLRDIATGSGEDIPEEPARYVEQPVEIVEVEEPEDEADQMPIVEDEPPPDLAELMRENHAYSDPDALLRLYNELNNKIMLNLADDADRALVARLHGGLDWIKRNAIEVI